MGKYDANPRDMFNTTFEDLFSEEVWRSTYKDHNDKTINDTLFRVAKAAASVEETPELQETWTINFYDLLSNFKATSGGRIYSNAGTEWKGTTLMNCVSGDTKILTSDGIVFASNIADKTVNVLTANGDFQEVNWKSFGVQELYKITFSNGEIIHTTGHHEWIVSKPKGGFERVTTTDLQNKRIPLNGIKHYVYKNLDEYEAGIRNGLVFGDGYTYTDFSNGNRYSALQQFGDSRHLVLDYFKWLKVTNYKGDKEGIHYVNGMPAELKELPKLSSSIDYLRGFIAGLIAADGCVDSRGSVVLHTAVYDYAVKIKDIAIRAGLPVISLRLEREESPFDGKKSELWKLTFVKKYFRNDKKLIIKNTHIEKIENSPDANTTTTIKCVGVEKTNVAETVYCCNEPTTHAFTLGEFGLLTGNCFVSPRRKNDIDSLDGILESVRSQSFTLKSEGGWGENFSYIRPRGFFIHGIGVETPGAVKYMEVFDKTSEIITAGAGKKAQNKKAKGKIRKGAMMGVLDCWHPDIIEFISAKQQSGRLTKFNMSVNCTDDFMDKVLKVIDMKNKKAPKEEIEKVDSWDLRFPDTTFKSYKTEWDGNLKKWVEKGYPVIVAQTVSASWLWNLIMESTYNRAEPGVLFLDRANFFGPLSYKETIAATNPCGEQMLAPGGVCNLGSLNLTQFINNAKTGFNISRIKKYVSIMVRFLDNISSLSSAPLPEYVKSMRDKRRIGIGILGWGSALYMLKVRFGSEEAAALRDKVMNAIAREAYMSSIDLAIEKGMFKECIPEQHAQGHFVNSLGLSKEYMDKLSSTGIRNSSLLSIQPTGNTSIQANIVSGGLEPVFMHEYIRTVIINTMPDEIADVTPVWYEGEWHETPLFKFAKEGDEEILKGKAQDGTVYKIDKNRGLTKEVLCEDYGVRYLKSINEWEPDADWAVTTDNLTVEDHVNDLKGFARWVDSAMSKTVNVPQNYPFEKFQNIYLDSYRSGYVKGVTTYRSGIMTTVLSAKEEKNAEPDDEEIIKEDVKLPDSANAVMKTIRAENRKWYLTVVYHENQQRPFALFVKTNAHEKGVVADDAVELLFKLARKKRIPKRHIDAVSEKLGADDNSSKVARLISFLLRHGVLIKNIVATLDKVETAYVGTFVFQIKKFLSSYIKDGEKVEDEVCQECGSTNVVFSEGCKKCMSCGSSKCG